MGNIACRNSDYSLGRRLSEKMKFVRPGLIFGLGILLASCATQPAPKSAGTRASIQNVRTTAYTHSEGSGEKNAIGLRLSGGRLKSASADWARFPLGTRFRLLRTGNEYVIDDYGGALVGTSTIDLYMTTRAEMRRWGVRHEDIEIIHWGSEEESLKILRTRTNVGRVRRMIFALEEKEGGTKKR
jgi:3D (Asp-Asp-Asp) domain-containing protein